MSGISRRIFLKSSALGPRRWWAPWPRWLPRRCRPMRLIRQPGNVPAGPGNPGRGGYDLVVAGGGPAGTAAAVSAARWASPALEATGCLGGMGTSGLVTAFDPMADGQRMLGGRPDAAKSSPPCTIAASSPRTSRPTSTASGSTAGLPSAPRAISSCWTSWWRRPASRCGSSRALVDADADAGKRARARRDRAEHRRLPLPAGQDLHRRHGRRRAGGPLRRPCREAGRDTPNIMPPTLCSLARRHRLVAGRLGRPAGPARWKRPSPTATSAPDRHLPGLFQVGQIAGHAQRRPHLQDRMP